MAPEMVEMVSVASSQAEAVGYDPDRQDLYIQYRSGGVYVYSDVPPSEYEAMLGAPSIGRFLNERIKTNYPCQKQ